MARTEKDLLGERAVGDDVLWGIHTERARENFPIAGRPVHPALVHAFGAVKLACARTNRALGFWADDPAKADAIEQSCRDLARGALDAHVVVDELQGGAGTSTNMNVNEVLANRALELLGEPRGRYARVSPLDDLNLHQSTNDTYPTALKLAAIQRLHGLERSLVALQEAFQAKEKAFAHVVKVGRTQLQDAVLTTLGREMGAYAEALSRDRWRVYKCEERLRVVNLGGTAIGTGLAAPRQFIFRVVDALREETGEAHIGFARAENLVENTQNADVFVEVSGILKACAATLLKICSDLRLLSSGPETGFGELVLPERQAGSSIMPGKVNPVIPEAVSQVAMKVFGLDSTLAVACASGNLELNPFLPLVASCLLESLDLLDRGCDVLRRNCVEGLAADEARCRRNLEGSTAVATALLPALGYERASQIAQKARESGRSVRETVLSEGALDEKTFDGLISPEAVCRLGTPEPSRGG
ncbi:MAG: aspartate ammonia-lyase [Myxococcales bacterium]